VSAWAIGAEIDASLACHRWIQFIGIAVDWRIEVQRLAQPVSVLFIIQISLSVFALPFTGRFEMK
jgi:hypothetical protein